MSIRKYFSSFDNSGITYSMNEKLEVENTIYEYLNDTLFKKRHAMDILNNIDVYPYKDDIISLLYNLLIYIKPEKLYDASTLDKLIRMNNSLTNLAKFLLSAEENFNNANERINNAYEELIEEIKKIRKLYYGM